MYTRAKLYQAKFSMQERIATSASGIRRGRGWACSRYFIKRCKRTSRASLTARRKIQAPVNEQEEQEEEEEEEGGGERQNFRYFCQIEVGNNLAYPLTTDTYTPLPTYTLYELK